MDANVFKWNHFIFTQEKKPAKSVLQAVKEFEHKKAQEESKSSLGVLEAVQMEYENYKKSQAQTNAQSKETESQQEESQEQEPEIVSITRAT